MSEQCPQDETIARGDHLILSVRVIDQRGDVVDLTGVQAADYDLARKAKGSGPVLSKSLADGIEVTDPAAGLIEITITSSETQFLGGRYYHEARITDVAGRSARIFYGTLTVAKSLA